MRQHFGMALVAQVLTGSENKRVKQFGFEKLSTFGLFKGRSQKAVNLLIQRLVATGYLEVESEHSTLRLLPPSYPVLKGQATVMLSLKRRTVFSTRCGACGGAWRRRKTSPPSWSFPTPRCGICAACSRKPSTKCPRSRA